MWTQCPKMPVKRGAGAPGDSYSFTAGQGSPDKVSGYLTPKSLFQDFDGAFRNKGRWRETGTLIAQAKRAKRNILMGTASHPTSNLMSIRTLRGIPLSCLRAVPVAKMPRQLGQGRLRPSSFHQVIATGWTVAERSQRLPCRPALVYGFFERGIQKLSNAESRLK